MEYDRKIRLSNFYELPFQLILTYFLNNENELITEVNLGPRRILKLDKVNVNSIKFTFWYKNKNGKILYDTINVRPIKKEDKYELNIREIFKDIIDVPLKLNGFTITDHKKYPDRFQFDVFKNGLVIKQKTWLDCNYYTTIFYLKNNTIKDIKDNNFYSITYESVFGDMDEFYEIMENILNETHKGSTLDLLDTFGSITEFVAIGDMGILFEKYKEDIIRLNRFNIDIEVNINNKYLKDIVKKVLESKDNIDLTNNINKLKLCGYL